MRAASRGLLARDPTGLTQKSISMGLLDPKAFAAVCWCEGDSRQKSAADTVGKHREPRVSTTVQRRPSPLQSRRSWGRCWNISTPSSSA